MSSVNSKLELAVNLLRYHMMDEQHSVF